MPKLKTHRGAAKRFRFTGKGKIKHKKAGLRHLLHQDDAESKRQRGRIAYVSPSDEDRIRAKMPYGNS